MDEYQMQALNFLKKCDAFLEIRYLYDGNNELWDEKDVIREVYNVKITTPRGSYSFKFYDSVHNYERKKQIKKIRTGYDPYRRSLLTKEYNELRPTEYDVLTCLTPYDVGTFKDFCWSYGYDEDSMKAFKTYLAVQEEYDGLRRIFTKEQLDMLSEIQ